MKHIYLMLSKTPTKFAYLIRKIGHTSYNHAAISLDEDLQRIYAFARTKHHALLVGGLVKEDIARYTLRKNKPVPIVVYKLPVTEQQYEWLETTIHSMMNDPEYMYNLFSVLSYPITKGFETYKAYSCTEFVTYVLKQMEYPINRPCYSYKPDDLLSLLEEYRVYEGDVRGKMISDCIDEDYFEPFTLGVLLRNLKALYRISRRVIQKKG